MQNKDVIQSVEKSYLTGIYNKIQGIRSITDGLLCSQDRTIKNLYGNTDENDDDNQDCVQSSGLIDDLNYELDMLHTQIRLAIDNQQELEKL